MGNERSMSDSASAKSACKSSKTRKHVKEQILHLVALRPGSTATQLAWINAGFSVDAQGYCQPADVYAKCQTFFNGKRRASEISTRKNKFDDEGNRKAGKHRPLVNIGRARANPHDDAVGLYPLGMTTGEIDQIAGKSIEPVVVETDDVPDEFTGIAGAGDIMAMLKDDESNNTDKD